MFVMVSFLHLHEDRTYYYLSSKSMTIAENKSKIQSQQKRFSTSRFVHFLFMFIFLLRPIIIRELNLVEGRAQKVG